MPARKVVAKVGAQELYQWQLDETVESYACELLKKTVRELSSTEYNDSVEKAIEKLIGGELFYLEALDAGYSATDDETGQYIDDVYNPGGDEAVIEEYLDYRGIDRAELEAVARKVVIKDKFVNTLLGRIPPATPDEIGRYYEKIKGSLFMPPLVEFHILFIERPSPEAAARFRAAFSNLESKSFEPEFAMQVMRDFAEAVQDGRFVTISNRTIDELPVETARVIREIGQGFFSHIFHSEAEISILYMARKEINRPMDEKDAREEAGKYLNLVRLRKILDAYVESLREKYPVTVFL